MGSRTHSDMIAVAPEADFVTGFDAEFVTQLLRNHDLPLGPYSMSHTFQYNPSWRLGVAALT